MIENENVYTPETGEEPAEVAVATNVSASANASSEQKEGFGAKVKEWFRKKIVGLKRKPQNISLFLLCVTTLFYLLSLSTLSPGPVVDFSTTATGAGLCIFVNTLFSILVLVLFLNVFPKHPKVNKKTGVKHRYNFVMLVLVFVFIAVMITMDVLYCNIMLGQVAGSESLFFGSAEQAAKYQQYCSAGYVFDATKVADNYKSYLISSLNISIAHIVLLAIGAVLIATLPLYKKLILKINTSKVVEGNNNSEVIDIEDE